MSDVGCEGSRVGLCLEHPTSDIRHPTFPGSHPTFQWADTVRRMPPLFFAPPPHFPAPFLSPYQEQLDMLHLGLKVMCAVFAFAFGACAGSLINVLVYRLPRGLDVVWTSSRCPACET